MRHNLHLFFAKAQEKPQPEVGQKRSGAENNRFRFFCRSFHMMVLKAEVHPKELKAEDRRALGVLGCARYLDS